jgi:signal transduction histidine kinase
LPSKIGAKVFAGSSSLTFFDRFTRGSEAQARTDGSGLGLAIARACARAHGGDIVYEPAMPHGARFEVVLPVRL